MTQDPLGLAGGVNLYAYAGNNPVSFWDPYGLCEKGNSTQSQHGILSDCEKFARMVDEVARNSSSSEEFVRQMGKTFAGFPTGRLTLSPKPVDRSLGLKGTGFRREMNDGDGHPWRHGSAFVVAGYDLGPVAAKGLALAWETPGLRGASVQDVRLGANAAEIGVGLKNGTIRPSQVAQWIRAQW